MKKLITLFSVAWIGLSASSNAQIALQENFEGAPGNSLPAGWIQTTKATTGWKTNTGILASIDQWSIPAHSKYAVVDEWNNNEDNDSTTLVSPIFSLVGISNAWLTFDNYFVKAAYNGGASENAFVFISTNGGTTWTVIDTLAGDGAKWQYNAISLAAYASMPNLKLAFSYHDGKGGASKLIGCALDNIKVAVPATDARVLTVSPLPGSPTSYGIVNGSLPLSGELYNYGTTPITTFTIKYRVGTNAVVSDIISGVSIPMHTAASFTTTPVAIPGTNGLYNVNMWVELPGDANPANDSAATSITATNFMPVKKILAEEGTGTWCGFCPRGAVYMDSVAHNYASSFSLVAVHNNDPMEVTAYDAFMGSKINGYPSMLIDRREVLDPSDLINVYNTQKNNFGFADIDLINVAAESFGYKVKASVRPAIDLSGDYRLVLILTEDGVHGTTNGWEQHNYFSGGAYGPMSGYETKPAVIPGAAMHYDHVGRMIIPSPTGAANSLPPTMTAGSTYDYTFETIIPQPYDRNKMHAVVALIRNGDGVVLNSNNMTIPLGISNVAAAVEKMLVYPNPATDKAFVDFTITEKTTVQVQVIDAMGRVANTISAQTFEKGNHILSVNTTNLPAGIYTIKLQTSIGTTTHQLSVIR